MVLLSLQGLDLLPLCPMNVRSLHLSQILTWYPKSCFWSYSGWDDSLCLKLCEWIISLIWSNTWGLFPKEFLDMIFTQYKFRCMLLPKWEGRLLWLVGEPSTELFLTEEIWVFIITRTYTVTIVTWVIECGGWVILFHKFVLACLIPLLMMHWSWLKSVVELILSWVPESTLRLWLC